uniref:RNA helicase C-terminal domain-containing protein n=1 Tax=Aegilops tauschii subsp. strangulata TaxID=200361 RepID=A0A453C005_AEGTS
MNRSMLRNKNLYWLCFQAGVVIIDGWLRLTAAAQTAVLFKQLRITLDAVLKELTRKPEVCCLLFV